MNSTAWNLEHVVLVGFTKRQHGTNLGQIDTCQRSELIDFRHMSIGTVFLFFHFELNRKEEDKYRADASMIDKYTYKDMFFFYLKTRVNKEVISMSTNTATKESAMGCFI